MPLNKPIEKRYSSITEVAKTLGVNASQLRYWEKEFALLRPRTNARGKRFYTTSDIQLIKEIHFLVKEEGRTLVGARKALKKRNEVQLSMQTSELPFSEMSKRDLLEKLKGLREKLLQLQEEQDQA
jgi:DNA-binding transcriptional MerR regulator